MLLPAFALFMSIAAGLHFTEPPVHTAVVVRGFPPLRREQLSLRARRLKFKAQNIPKGGRIAVLMRGHFRGGSLLDGCKKLGVSPCQVKATQSFMDKVMMPLQARNNTIDVFVTDIPCNMADQLHDTYLPQARFITNNVKALLSRVTFNTFNETMRFFQDTLNTSKAESVYDMVIITRHDILWKKSLYASKILNFSNFNFASPCEGGANQCVSDVLQVMPASFFNTFSESQCFSNDHGYNCHASAMKASHEKKASVGYAFWSQGNRCTECKNKWYSICKDN